MPRSRPLAAVLLTGLLVVSGCSSTRAGTPVSPTSSSASSAHRTPAPITLPARTSASAPPPSASSSHRSSPPATHTSAPPTTSAAPPRTSSAAPPAGGDAPVIVIDPGHSPTAHGIDPATGLDLTDYENEPEMQDVFAVALLVKSALEHDGYRVYLTKKTADTPANLGVRAYLANRVHADLALSIHDQAGANGGLAFSASNNNVYYQAVGDYRTNPQGHDVVFDNAALAATSKKYGAIFQQQRQAREGHTVHLLSNTGYNLGSRGLQAGNIWIVQLLSTVPWIYNEAGGNSAGMVGLSAHDKQLYADGLVAGVEHCIAPPR